MTYKKLIDWYLSQGLTVFVWSYSSGNQLLALFPTYIPGALKPQQGTRLAFIIKPKKK